MRIKLFSQLRLIGEAEIGMRAKAPAIIIWGNRTFERERAPREAGSCSYFEVDGLHLSDLDLANPDGIEPPLAALRNAGL